MHRLRSIISYCSKEGDVAIAAHWQVGPTLDSGFSLDGAILCRASSPEGLQGSLPQQFHSRRAGKAGQPYYAIYYDLASSACKSTS